MKLGVLGTITLSSHNDVIVESILDGIVNYHKINVIMSQFAPGAEGMALNYATRNNIFVSYIDVDWIVNGVYAHDVRNKKLLKVSDYCLCMWDGKDVRCSRFIEQSKQYDTPLYVYNFKTLELYECK